MSGRLLLPPNTSARLEMESDQSLPALPSTSSSLHRFVKAKGKIEAVYEDISVYVNEVSRFLNSLKSSEASALKADSFSSLVEGCLAPGSCNPEIADEDSVERVNSYVRQVDAIRQVLSRNQMKVVFFGRTSNGKSTAINALLGDRILPTGIGHTTSCFLQVEGGDEQDAYLMTENDNDDDDNGGGEDHQAVSDGVLRRRSVQSICQLGSALSSEKLDASAMIKIVWPKQKCKMLAEEVVLIDSPGIDVETDLDAWIDRVCLDSDVFILVANSESTIMLTEKKFFHKVSERFSRPNIFILHNRSDAFAGEEMVSEVRKQHTERAMNFLVNELKVCSSRSEAAERIFFISAKEALTARLQESKGLPPQISTEDFFPRYLEFQEFERRFTDCLSRTAVRTKFAQHSKQGSQIVRDVAGLMADVNGKSTREHQVQMLLRKELCDKKDFVLKQLELMTLDMKDKIRAITEDVEFKVGKAMSEEIRRLSVLVDEFSDSFHPDPLVLNVYKSRLNHHIEAGIGSNMKTRLSSDLQFNIEIHEKEMISRMTALLPADKQQVSRNILPRRDNFEVMYHLHFDSLCADFVEDIRFRFSLGFSSIVKRFLAKGQKKNVLGSGSSFGSSPLSRRFRRDESASVTPPLGSVPDEWSVATKVALAAVSSHGTMGGLLIGGLLLKTVGWRAIAAISGLYGGLYLYERLTWTNNAKCREFKRQYVDHAARKLRLVVDMTSANCSHQVQQELSSTFARLCRLVDEAVSDLKEGISRVDSTTKRLEDAVNRSKVLKNQASFIANKLDLFDQNYLLNHSAGGVSDEN